MRILVTGHKGYIGAVLARMAEARGHEVLGLDSDLYRNSTYGGPLPDCAEIIKDIRDVEKRDIEGVEGIIHLAGLSNDTLGDLDPELTREINYAASVRLAAMAKESGIERFVFASSCSNYGAGGDVIHDESSELNPVTPYAESKVLTELEVGRLADDMFSPVFMRNATAYGASPRMRFDIVLNNLTAWAYTTGRIYLKSDGKAWRPLAHVRDISRAAIAALEVPRELIHNEVFNVGRNSDNHQVRDLAEIVGETIPNCEIRFAEGAEADTRNYRVNFGKYARVFSGYECEWDVRRGARELHEFYRTHNLAEDEYEGFRYKRIAQIQWLLKCGWLGDDLRWKRAPRNVFKGVMKVEPVLGG